MSNTLQDDLLPCPLCGDLPQLNKKQMGHTWYYFTCPCGLKSGMYANKEQLNQAWNKRTPPDNWVSVRDGFPEEGEKVLFCFKSGYIGTADHKEGGFYYSEDEKEEKYTLRYANVTHWQPLPEPPKENKND